MISTVLVEHPWLTTTALVGLVALGPPAGWWLAARPRVAWWLAAASMVPLVMLTLVPVDRELFARCTVQWSAPTPGRVELMANLVLFVPPVLLAGVASGRPGRVLLVGSLVSVVVEATQAVVPAIGRSCDTSDWLANTLGAGLGATLAWLALRLRAARPQGLSRAGR